MALKGASDFLRAFCSVQTERRQCAEHGGYAAKSVLRGVWTGCPAC
ncbi:DNA replication protein, partial [Neisseria gonorrhoeae]